MATTVDVQIRDLSADELSSWLGDSSRRETQALGLELTTRDDAEPSRILIEKDHAAAWNVQRIDSAVRAGDRLQWAAIAAALRHRLHEIGGARRVIATLMPGLERSFIEAGWRHSLDHFVKPVDPSTPAVFPDSLLQLKPLDHDEQESFFEEIEREHTPRLEAAGQVASAQVSREVLRRASRDGRGVFFGGFHGGELAARCWLTEYDREADGLRVVFNVFDVLPGHRGSRALPAMYASLSAHYRARGLRQAEMKLYADDAKMHALAQHTGFEHRASIFTSQADHTAS